MSLPPFIEALLDPRCHPHQPAAVTLVQTHISFVLLAGSEVYKIKKPARFSFLDFSTLEQRHHFCREEVRLNRRLAPGVYLGVLSICPDAGRYRLGAEDDPAAVEYAVHMRHLPQDRILTALLERGAVTPPMIDAVAELLVDFHRRAACGPQVQAAGDPAAIAAVLADNYAAVRPFRDRIISAADDDAIQAFCRAALERLAPLLRRRQAEQRIRDCHGDLHAEHVCFTDPPVIFDCIEFTERFRYCDVAAEIAFLAMDLVYRGAPDLAAQLVGRYAALAGDPELPRLIPFYACYRAYVRGMVDALTSDEPEVAAAVRAAADAGARRHFALAYRYTWADSPCLVVVAGLSGSGKSGIATALAARTGFVHLNSDVVRKQLAGLPPDARPGEAIYSAAHSERTYTALIEGAREALAGGRGVILDATFQLRKGRDAARALAAQCGIPVLIVECTCGPDEVRRRLAARQASGTNPSDADWQVYLQQRDRYQAFAPDEQETRLALDTSGPVDDAVARVELALRARASAT